MANENQNQGGEEGRKDEFDKEKTEGQTGQQGSIGGQQGQQGEFGQQTGQGQTGQQGETGASVADRTGQQSPGAGSTGGGFVGAEGEDTGEYLREGETEQAGFAEQGRGAPQQDEDIERGGGGSTDIEGGGEDR